MEKLILIVGLIFFNIGIVYSQSTIFYVDQNHPNASDFGSGTINIPFITISQAAKVAQPGDEIIVFNGVYRETIIPPRGGKLGNPITYRAAEGEDVYIKGSDVFSGEWEETENPSIFRANLNMESLKDFNAFAEKLSLVQDERYPEMDSLMQYCRGQVFVNNIMFDEVNNIIDLKRMSRTWYSENNGKSLLVHFPENLPPPKNCLVELTVRSAVFRPTIRGLGYINVYGFIMEHAANQGIVGFWRDYRAPQQGLISTRSGHHWNICKNVIRYAKALGLDVGSERSKKNIVDGQPSPDIVGSHLIKDNIISDNGQGGIAGSRHIGTKIIDNILERNNNLGFATSEESAIKTHHFINGEISGNLIRDNYTNGIWLDNTFQNINVIGNVILNNTGRGILLEMGIGPCLVANNIIGNNENGIYVHDAGGFVVAHNFVIENKNFGIYARMVDERSCEVFPDSIQSFEEPALDTVLILGENQKYFNNIFVKNSLGSFHWIYPGSKGRNNISDGNLFIAEPMWFQFELNDDGGMTVDQILMESETMEKYLVGPKKPLTGFHNLLINMEQWNTFIGNDKNSGFAQMKQHWQIMHSGANPWLNFQLILETKKAVCHQIEGLTTDFFGNKFGESIVPGPFQNMNSDGFYHYRIWPKN